MREAAAFGLCLFALLCILTQCTGCEPPTPKDVLSVENASAVAQYDLALVECKKAANHDFDAYVACEDALTLHYCRESASLRKAWPKCKEVLHEPR